jgi:hypothetical protein
MIEHSSDHKLVCSMHVLLGNMWSQLTPRHTPPAAATFPPMAPPPHIQITLLDIGCNPGIPYMIEHSSDHKLVCSMHVLLGNMWSQLTPRHTPPAAATFPPMAPPPHIQITQLDIGCNPGIPYMIEHSSDHKLVCSMHVLLGNMWSQLTPRHTPPAGHHLSTHGSTTSHPNHPVGHWLQPWDTIHDRTHQ